MMPLRSWVCTIFLCLTFLCLLSYFASSTLPPYLLTINKSRPKGTNMWCPHKTISLLRNVAKQWDLERNIELRKPTAVFCRSRLWEECGRCLLYDWHWNYVGKKHLNCDRESARWVAERRRWREILTVCGWHIDVKLSNKARNVT